MSEQTKANPSDAAAELDRAREFLAGILSRMKISAEVECDERDDRLALDIELERDGDLNRLTGRGGQVLDALQHLVGKMLAKDRGERGKPVVVDAGGFRKQEVERLESLAVATAEKCLDRGRPVALDPMNPYDRRIVHMRIAEIDGVVTESEGEGDDRHVVVKPADD